jgi:hypothetical protein
MSLTVNQMIKISRGFKGRQAGLINDLLVRAGLRTPPSKLDPKLLGAGAAAAGGLGLAGLSAAYPEEAGQFMGDVGKSVGGAVGDYGDELNNLMNAQTWRNPSGQREGPGLVGDLDPYGNNMFEEYQWPGVGNNAGGQGEYGATIRVPRE